MNEEKIKLLCNGIASISDALDESFFDILSELNDYMMIDDDTYDRVKEYMESL